MVFITGSSKKVLKLIIAGDGGIGKTTLMKSFCYDQFIEDQKITVGGEIFIKKFIIKGSEGYMQVWDLSGQDRFRFFFENLIRGATAAILGFDVVRRKSFMDLKVWLELLRKNTPNLPITLIGTKLDIGYHPTLNAMMAQTFVKDNNLLEFTEISSKTRLNIDKPFKILVKSINKCPEEDITFLEYELDAKMKTTLTQETLR